MKELPKHDRLIRFSVFEVDRQSGELFKQGRKVKLQGQPFELLVSLLERPGEVLSREELRQRIWPSETAGDFDHGLNRAVNKVREALGDSADAPQFVETLPRKGYRFIGAVTAASLPPVNPSNLTRPKLRRKTWVLVALAVPLLGAVSWFMLRHSAGHPTRVTQEQLTFSSVEDPVRTATISPDGKYLAYSDRAGIHVKLLSTGEERLLPKPPVPTPAYWDVASWFPDGTQVLANLSEPDAQDSMWSISVLGQSARELRDGALGLAVSPDGAQIAFTPRGHRGAAPPQDIYVTGIQGDNVRKIVSAPAGESLFSVRWSPDGNRLVYIRGWQKSLEVFAGYIESSDLRGVARRISVPASDLRVDALWWLVDGRLVYFRQESAATYEDNLWEIYVDQRTGAPTSEPKRITDWTGVAASALTASANGKQLAFEEFRPRSQVYLGELSRGETGVQLLMPRTRRFTNEDSGNFAWAWTADSKSVFLSSYRNGKEQLFKQDIGQNRAEPLVTGPQSSYMPRLSADGRWLLYASAPAAYTTGPAKLMRVPVGGGSPQVVMAVTNARDWHCSNAAANVCVIIESNGASQFTVTAFDPLKGRGKLLRRFKLDYTRYVEGLSPDGSTLALAKTGDSDTHIQLIPLVGGSERTIVAKGFSNITGIDWAPDGAGFYCGSESPERQMIAHVDLNGKWQQLWEPAMGPACGIPSPDGHFLAINDAGVSNNVWMLQNF
jgi:Tol biopolymer transport system component/DNA-binding winged helix-turn-helix (wHTH) protein